MIRWCARGAISYAIDQPYAVLLEAFAAPSAMPGGISAACLAAASAAALVERCGAAAAPTAERRGAGRRAALLRHDLVAAADADLDVLRALAQTAPAGRAAAVAAASGRRPSAATPPPRSSSWQRRSSVAVRRGCGARRAARRCWPTRPHARQWP